MQKLQGSYICLKMVSFFHNFFITFLLYPKKIVLQTFKVKLFLENSLWSNILNHLKTNVTP